MSLTFPAGFDKCVKEKGRVRTIAVGKDKNQYMHVCYLDGKSYSGEVKTKKEASEISAYLQNQGYTENNGEFIKASENMLRKLVPQIALSEVYSSKDKTSEIEILHAGVWEHPQYGTISITNNDIDKFLDSFNEKVRKVDIAVDQEHMPEKGAAGWFRSMKKVFEDGKTKLKATVEWTKLGTQLITDGIFKYFSPEFDFAYEDQETHEQYENVLLGGALTNRPYFKSLAPVALSENMYAGFISSSKIKGGERKMLTKKKLMAILAKDSNFALSEKASKRQVKLFNEAKDELAKKVVKTKKSKKKVAVKSSERFISSTDHLKQMNEVKARLGIAEKKLQFKEVAETVDGFVFSESNSDGVLLPKNKKVATELLMSASPKVAKLFKEFLSELPKVSAKLFREEGTDEDKGGKKDVNAMAVKLMQKDGSITFSEAMNRLQDSNPELFENK